jgi:hypothetical protein
MTALEDRERLLGVGYGPSPQCVERRLRGAHQPFTPRRLSCIHQRPLGRIASMPATGHFLPFPWTRKSAETVVQTLFDDSIRAKQDGLRDGDAKLARRLKVDTQSIPTD